VKLQPHSLTQFTSKLATLLGAGVPLVKALEGAGLGDDPELNRISHQLVLAVLSGRRLSQAMQDHAEVFTPFYLNLVQVGEEGGGLVVCLTRLAGYLQAGEERRMRLMAALIYPAVVLTVMAGLCAFFLLTMVPHLTAMLSGMGLEMPALTRMVLLLGDRRLLLVGIGLGLLGLAWVRVAASTPGGRVVLDTLRYEAPLVGPLAREVLLARFSQSLELMLEVGFSWTRALALVRTPSSGSLCFDEVLAELEGRIQGGEFQEAVELCPAFPPLLRSLILAGVEARAVPRFLGYYSRLAEMRVDLAITNLLQIVEPLALLMLGIVVGTLVTAMFLPIYQLLNTL